MTVHASRRFFFFPHALEASKRSPGRVAFDVEADLADSAGVRTRDEVVVMADGFEKNIIGPNQDPCVLSSPSGPVHTFCRIDYARGKDHYVKGTRRLLSQEVVSGDVIIYGKFVPRSGKNITGVWVDTVIVVRHPAPWSTARRKPRTKCTNVYCKRRKRCRKFMHEDPVRFAATLGADASSDLLEFNLRDGGSEGSHSCTSVQEYLVILGKVSTEQAAVAELATSFCPLGEKTADGWRPASVVETDIDGPRWKRIAEFLVAEVRGDGKVRGGSIAKFSDPEDARELVGALVRKSGIGQGLPGVVAIPPLKPARGLVRFDPVRRTRTVLRAAMR
jgi:hypothetical protein